MLELIFILVFGVIGNMAVFMFMYNWERGLNKVKFMGLIRTFGAWCGDSNDLIVSVCAIFLSFVVFWWVYCL